MCTLVFPGLENLVLFFYYFFFLTQELGGLLFEIVICLIYYTRPAHMGRGCNVFDVQMKFAGIFFLALGQR